MKRLLSNISSLLTILVFGALIIIFALSLKQSADISPGEGQAQPAAYPGPNMADLRIESLEPYPAPVNANRVEQESCEGMGKWVTNTDTVGGYSLKYPAESSLHESAGTNKYITISLRPSCYGHQCGGSNEVVIGLKENPQKLPVREFVEQEFSLDSSPPTGSSLRNLHQSGRFVTIAGVMSLRIEEGITLNKPDIFIPNEDKVIWIYVSKASSVPPHDPPCKQTLELLDGILNSIELHSPATSK